MPPFLLVGLAAGIASALLFASASAGGLAGRMLLFFLAPLPTYLAGLGWGAVAAGIAAVISALGAATFLGAKTGAVYLLGHGLPAVVLCYLALLNRPVATSGDPSEPDVEWYPPGRILSAATLMAGALALLTVLLIATDLDTLRQMMREFLDKVILKQMPSLGSGQLGEAELAMLTELMVYALPAGSASLWLSGFLLNIWLAGRITQFSGRLPRPWPDLAAARFPPRFGLGLALAVTASVLLSGYPGLVAWSFVGAYFLAYTLMGLAIVHYATRGLVARPLILWAVYAALLMLNTWAAMPIALLAVLEPVLPWRRPPEGAPGT
jgi:hypothetical protein